MAPMKIMPLAAVLGLSLAPCQVLAAGAPAVAAPSAPAQGAGLPEKIACPEKTKASIHTKDAQRLGVTLLAMDARGADYLEKTPFDGDRKGRVGWTMMTAADAADVLKAGVDPKDAAQLAFAGRVLQGMPDGGGKEAAKWYALAAKAGGQGAAPAIEAARKAPGLFPPALVPGSGGSMPSGRYADEWPAETGGSYRDAVRGAVERTNAALAAGKIRMQMNQNSLFILYSDLAPEETKKWAGRFQMIYEGMCQAFGMDPKHNIWHGKAVILLFKSQAEYLAYHAQAKHGNVAGSAGLSVSSSLGDEEISMFEDPGNPDLSHVLYHEFSHGFLFRYKSSQNVPSWANEGLAEFMAARFTGANHSDKPRVLAEVAALRQGKSLEDFFSARNIQGKHYGVAEDIARMMIECDPRRYAAFLSWLKHGADNETALKKSYGLTVEELVKAYARRIGADALKSH